MGDKREQQFLQEGWREEGKTRRKKASVVRSRPVPTQMSVLVFQDAFPLRFKGVQGVREPSVITMIFTIMKQFLKEKLIKRVSTLV